MLLGFHLSYSDAKNVICFVCVRQESSSKEEKYFPLEEGWQLFVCALSEQHFPSVGAVLSWLKTASLSGFSDEAALMSGCNFDCVL